MTWTPRGASTARSAGPRSSTCPARSSSRSAAGQLLGFFEESAFARDAGTPDATPATTGLTLSHNVGSRAAVVELVQAMVAAGGTVRKEPQEGEFGGVFHAHVADPNGLVWEVAHNPALSVRADGSVDLG
ncbi:VOC family protein [Cellulosimicrobium sp. I38E]|uniref:VOC family protein n=1 Tax=Cellulosimicrobium sp. I38E TaxID=1393139 RepID=UPI002100CB0D|nr:VOC family protein [Cellulosimicrobium sp. I38E]